MMSCVWRCRTTVTVWWRDNKAGVDLGETTIVIISLGVCVPSWWGRQSLMKTCSQRCYVHTVASWLLCCRWHQRFWQIGQLVSGSAKTRHARMHTNNRRTPHTRKHTRKHTHKHTFTDQTCSIAHIHTTQCHKRCANDHWGMTSYFCVAHTSDCFVPVNGAVVTHRWLRHLQHSSTFLHICKQGGNDVYNDCLRRCPHAHADFKFLFCWCIYFCSDQHVLMYQAQLCHHTQ